MFKRVIEDFTCEQCGAEVHGDGYTNHCPKCLWSKHVDTSPGDRASNCGGAMVPIALEQKSGEFILTHKCEKCGHEKRNKTSGEDRLEELL